MHGTVLFPIPHPTISPVFSFNASAPWASAATGRSGEKTNKRIGAKRVRPTRKLSEREVQKVVDQVRNELICKNGSRRACRKPKRHKISHSRKKRQGKFCFFCFPPFFPPFFLFLSRMRSEWFLFLSGG